MNVLGYTEGGIIRVIFDGDENESFVPDSMSNRHRFQIWDEWEIGPPDPETGERERVNTIPPFEPAGLSAADVDREHDRRAALGKTFAVAGYGDVPLEGSLRTQTVLLALKDSARDLQTAGIVDPLLMFTDRDNGDHYLTPAQVIDMVDQGKAYMQALHEAKRLLKAMEPIPADYADGAHWPPA